MPSSSRHHQHIRKRIHRKYEEYPHPDATKRMVDKLVYLACVMGPLFTMPQVLKIWVGKSATDLSIFTWGTYLVVAGIWLAYGLVHRERPIIFLNSSLLAINLMVVLGIVIYS